MTLRSRLALRDFLLGFDPLNSRMTKKQDLLDQIAELQAEVNILNTAPSDTYPLGTVVRFVANSNTIKWHYIKTSEETWLSMESSISKSLSEWILDAVDSSIGYFEVYLLPVADTPFYSHA